MKSRLGLFALLLLGLAALAGCATLEALMGDKPADSTQDFMDAPLEPAFTFYDSYAKW